MVFFSVAMTIHTETCGLCKEKYALSFVVIREEARSPSVAYLLNQHQTTPHCYWQLSS